MISPLSEQYSSFLRDESRLLGKADDISFPRTVEEVQEIASTCRSQQKAITVQGPARGFAAARGLGGASYEFE